MKDINQMLQEMGLTSIKISNEVRIEDVVKIREDIKVLKQLVLHQNLVLRKILTGCHPVLTDLLNNFIALNLIMNENLNSVLDWLETSMYEVVCEFLGKEGKA